MAWLDLEAEVLGAFANAAELGRRGRAKRDDDREDSHEVIDPAAAQVATEERQRQSNQERFNEWAAKQRIATLHRIPILCPVCGAMFEFIVGQRGRPQTHCTPRCARIAARREYRRRARDINSQTTKVMNANRLPPPTLTPELVERLRQAVVAEGAAAVARRLGLSRTSVLSVLAGVSAHPGTVMMVQRGFSDVSQPAAVVPIVPGRCA